MPMDMPMKKKPMDAMDQAMGDTGTVKLNVRDYPGLQGVQQGQKVTGSFEATVGSVEGDAATLSFDSIDMNTENSADRALSEMTGKKKTSAPAGQDEEDAY